MENRVGRSDVGKYVGAIDLAVYPVKVTGRAQVYPFTGRVESSLGRDITQTVSSLRSSYHARDWLAHFARLKDETVTSGRLLSSFDENGRFDPIALIDYLVRLNGVVRNDKETNSGKGPLEFRVGLYEPVRYGSSIRLHHLIDIFGIPIDDSGAELTGLLGNQGTSVLLFEPTHSLWEPTRVFRPPSKL